MEQETKKYLIIGSVMVISVGVGVVLWKKYQANAAGQTAAADQTNQDELSLLAASLESNAYASSTGAANFSPHAVGGGIPKSLADEVLELERALGFAPAAAPSSAQTPPAAAASGSSSPAATPAPSAVTPPASTPTHLTPAAEHDAAAVSEMIRYHHGSPIFSMDGIAGEGVLVQ